MIRAHFSSLLLFSYWGVPPSPGLFGIIELQGYLYTWHTCSRVSSIYLPLQAKTLKIFEFKGLIVKIFRIKDLAPRRALKMALGQLRGLGRRAHLSLPQSSGHFRTRWGWMSVTGITAGCDE